MEDREYYKSLADTENSNLNSRMGWFLTTQSLLLTAMVVGWEKDGLVLAVVSFLGVTTSFSYGIYLRCCISAFENIETKVKEKNVEMPIGLGREDVPKWYHFFMPWNILPACFVFVYILIVCYRIFVKW